MLLKVAVGAEVGESLAAHSEPIPAPALVRRLRELALLVTESSEGAAALLASLRGVPSQDLVSAITRLIQNRLVIASDPKPVPVDSIWSERDLQTWQRVADTVVLAEYRAELFASASQAPEVTSLAGLLTTEALERIELLREALVLRGTKRDTVWRERLAPLAAHSARVYIVDQYASAAVARDLAAGSAARHKSGATWLLRQLARSPVQHIYLASSASALIHDRREPSVVQTAIHEWFGSLRSSTQLSLVLSTSRFVHGRRLAFDAWAGFELHKGLASFDGPVIDETMAMTALPSLAADTRNLYRQLRST